MQESKYTLLRHLSAGLMAGMLFGLGTGLIFGLKMVGINESLFNYRLAYPFMLNFVSIYVLIGLVFGLIVSLIGSLLMRSTEEQKRLNFFANLGLSYAVFVIIFLILGKPLGVVCGMFLATLLFFTAHGVRPVVYRIYFSIFLTSILFNYSWQWVRQHFIVNPFMPIPNLERTDLAFTLSWALLFLIGFRIFLKPFFRLPAKKFYWIGTVTVIIAVIVGGIFYGVQPVPSEMKTATDLQVQRRPTDQKLLIIGIDGLWWEIIDPLVEQGRLPNLQALIDSGSSGPLETLFPTFSSIIWTSITTGKSAEHHGVTSFLVWKFPLSGYTVPCHITPKVTAEIGWMRRELITEAPITNQFMDAMPLWLILSDHGSTVGMVNWWVSWPAHQVNGFVVTDHCLYNKSNIMQNYKSKEGLTTYDIYPPELIEEVAEFSHSPDDITEDELRRFLNINNPQFIEEFRAIDTYDYLDIVYEASMFKYSYPEDVTYAAASEYLIKTQQTDFMAVYLKGMDSMEHKYLKYYYRDQHMDKLIPENVERYKDLIDNYYIYMDEVIGRFVQAVDSNTVVMVVSDHGFDEFILPTGFYNHMGSPPGVFLCSGPGIKKGYQVDNAHVYDITPTSLHLLGYPTAEDFDGKVLSEICTDSTEISVIPTYETGRRATGHVIESDIDDSYKEKLRALGYTQ